MTRAPTSLPGACVTDRDPRPDHVAADLRRAAGHIDAIAERLAGLQALDPIDRPRRELVRSRRTGPSDPTGGRLVAYESGLDWHLRQLVGWIEVRQPDGHEVLQPGAVHALEDLATNLGGTSVLSPHATRVREAGVATPHGRRALRRLTVAIHGALAEVHDGWHQLHQSRWVTTDRGVVLDEDADRDASFTASAISTLARDLARLARRLDPPKPVQPKLVYCLNHPDELAKYPKLQLCGACYERQRRRSAS